MRGDRYPEEEQDAPRGARQPEATGANKQAGGPGLLSKPTTPPPASGARPKPAPQFDYQIGKNSDYWAQWEKTRENIGPRFDGPAGTEDVYKNPAFAPKPFDYGEALQGSDATQTGFLNFDRFAAANQGVSRREAKRVDDMVNAQARKAFQAAKAAQQAYANQLKTLDSTGAFDAHGNWMPGSGGNGIAAYQAPQDPTGTFTSEELVGAEALGKSQDAYRQQLEQQMADLKDKAAKIPGFTDSAEYKEALKQAMAADEMLSALTGGKIDVDGDGEVDDYGLNVLSGGRGFDALLLGQAGRPGFRKTADRYSKDSLGADGITDYLNEVTGGRAQNSATQLSNSLNQKYADYQQALGDFDKRLMDEADVKKAAEEAKKNAPKTFSDLVKAGKDQGRSMTWDEVGKRGATNNARKLAYWKPFQAAIGESKGGYVGGPGQDAWELAEKKMKPLGLEGDAAAKYWDEFRNSLPEDLRNWVNGMISWDGDMGESHALANSDEDWVFFQELFDAYVKEHPPKKG